jgi:uroporphyrinogen III methyltransferase/synthase
MSGKAYLIGAGPGNLDLMTIKGMELIKSADVIVYDNLANSSFLSDAKSSCEKIFVGKMAGNHTMTQENINNLLVEKAKENEVVVRLKGGDPYVFGRGGEEGLFLLENKIDFEVVPGITSAIGGLAYGGIPITHREISGDFHVFTAHFKDDEKSIDFQTVAKLSGTLVFLMGVSNMNKIMEGLILGGKSGDTPCAVIRNASMQNQEVWTCKLSELGELKEENGIKPPCLIVVGEVVNLRNDLNFFENKPLFGKKIIVTRARTQNSSMVKKLADMGGETFEVPAIKIEEINNFLLSEEINRIDNYNYIIFTSVNGVQIFFSEFNKVYDSRKLFGKRIVAIGTATSEALKTYGIKADIIPEQFVGEGIVEILKEELSSDDNILIPRSFDARSYLVDSLSTFCNVKEIKIYKTVKEEIENISEIKELLINEKIDFITFTSSSTVKNFFEMFKDVEISKIAKLKIVSIGPITTSTVKQYGCTPWKEAAIYSVDGVINEIMDFEEDNNETY